MVDESNDGKVNAGVDDVMAQAKMGAAAAPAGEKQSGDTAGAQSPDNAQPKPSEDAEKATTADERLAENEQLDNMDNVERRKHDAYQRLKDAVSDIQTEMVEIGGTFGAKARGLLDEALVELRKSF